MVEGDFTDLLREVSSLIVTCLEWRIKFNGISVSIGSILIWSFLATFILFLYFRFSEG